MLTMDQYLVMALSQGLGNQLFQYASGYGIAARRGVELRLEDSLVRSDERWMPGILGPRYQAASRFELARLGEIGGGAGLADKTARELARRTSRGARRLRHRTPAVL